MKISLRNCGFIDPESIEQYIARGGYQALFKAVTAMTPEEVIAQVKAAGLRGRGGAGFPTGLKWEFCRTTRRDMGTVICNADGGRPGAFMDPGASWKATPHGAGGHGHRGLRHLGTGRGYLPAPIPWPSGC